MQLDELGTPATLATSTDHFFNIAVSSSGRNGVLIEFASAADAVEFAIPLQAALEAAAVGGRARRSGHRHGPRRVIGEAQQRDISFRGVTFAGRLSIFAV
jgi:hypothetical protein